MRVVGADWAGRGWVCVALHESTIDVAIHRAFGDVMLRYADAACIAVDIPIGLPLEAPSRRADLEARQRARSSTVFPTYPREVYECASHAAAVALCRERGWPGISRQSYGLWARIVEVEPFASGVHEVHPEISFWEMNGKTRLAASKHTWNGFFERRVLLEQAGISFPLVLDLHVPSTDLLDAASAAWSARRIALGVHGTLPAEPDPGEPTISF